jgi:hypothetical protein
LQVAINGLWLGVLSDSQLDALDERYYATSAQYRTDAWNEQGLFGWERQLVGDHFPARGRIVVLACGGGREVLALRDAGYDAVGYESHPALVAFARRFLADRGHRDCVFSMERDAFPDDAGACDAVIVGWGAYSLIGGSGARISFLRAAGAHLAAGDPVLVSFFERVAASRSARWTATIANALRRARGRAPIEQGDVLAPNRVHVFGVGAVGAEIDAAGFDVEVQGTIGPADEDTSYASAVLRRRP